MPPIATITVGGEDKGNENTRPGTFKNSSARSGWQHKPSFRESWRATDSRAGVIRSAENSDSRAEIPTCGLFPGWRRRSRTPHYFRGFDTPPEHREDKSCQNEVPRQASRHPPLRPLQAATGISPRHNRRRTQQVFGTPQKRPRVFGRRYKKLASSHSSSVRSRDSAGCCWSQGK